jgi:hypothetical protein
MGSHAEYFQDKRIQPRLNEAVINDATHTPYSATDDIANDLVFGTYNDRFA